MPKKFEHRISMGIRGTVAGALLILAATQLSADQIDEIFDLRALLEAELLSHSIQKLTPRDLLEAEAVLYDLEEAVERGDTQLATGKLNAEFHGKLYSKADRPQTSELVDMYSKNSERYVRMHILLAGGFATAPEEHRTLLELCKNKDIEQACAFLKTHILSAKEDIKALLIKREQE